MQTGFKSYLRFRVVLVIYQIHLLAHFLILLKTLHSLSYLVIFSDGVLSHFEGAQILVHVLHVRVIRGILAAVQQTLNGSVVIVNYTAVFILIVPC